MANYYTFELRKENGEVRKYLYNQSLTNSNKQEILNNARALIISDLNKNGLSLSSYKEVKVIIKSYREIRTCLKDYIFIDNEPIPAVAHTPSMSKYMFKHSDEFLE